MSKLYELDEHWEVYVKNQIASGKFLSESDVIAHALQEMETKERKLETLRAHITKGAEQAERGEFVPQDFDAMMAEFDTELEAEEHGFSR